MHFDNDNKNNKLLKVDQYLLISFGILLILVMGILVVLTEKTNDTKYYNYGVSLYNQEEYDEALTVFGFLRHYHFGENNGEEMYQLTLSKLKEHNNVEICPYCDTIIAVIPIYGD